MAKKRVTRKKLVKEPDEFISLTGKVIQWSRENTKQLIYGVCAVIAVVALISAYSMIRGKREKVAATLLSESLNAYEAAGGQSQIESGKALAAVKPDLERLVNHYAGQPEGRLGQIFYGHLILDNGAPDDAIRWYQKALGDFSDDPTLASAILNGLATASLEKGDNAAALGYFEKIATGPGTFLKDSALYHMGRLYRLSGELEKSKKAFEQLGADYPNSMYADLSREQSAG